MAIIGLDTDYVSKSVVFIYGSDATGKADTALPLGTGFLIRVPNKQEALGFDTFIATARHIVDPVWTGCPNSVNPTRIFIRMNTLDPSPPNGPVRYLAVDLVEDGKPRWFKHSRDDVDAAVIPFPSPSTNLVGVDVKTIPFSRIPTESEIAQIEIGNDIVSPGLLPPLRYLSRNYPIFKFGKISSIPKEDLLTSCTPDQPLPRKISAWVMAVNLVPGNSGSPIFYVPVYPEGGDIRGPGIDRTHLLGLQSSSIVNADVAMMTPASYIFDIVESIHLPGADLSRGKAVQAK